MKVFSFFDKPGSLAGAINFANSIDRTHQEFKDECDINQILRRYQATGVMPQPWKSPPTPQWGDFASAPDFFEAQQLLLNAKQAFLGLPSRVRSRFNNNPGELLAFIQDTKNRDEAIALGLVNPPVAAASPATPPEIPPKG